MARLWVIEALASYDKLVDSSVLQELVKKTPEIIGDLGKDAREIINFRVLDTLASREVGSTVSEDKFDKSESCENVVWHMLSERTDEEEMLRSGVQNFIARKRASLPKYTLRKLKDAIIEGKHPALASLKERSKLPIRNKSGKRIVLDYANPKEATGASASQTVADGENLTTANVENLNGYSQGDCRTKPKETTYLSDSQTVAQGENITTPNVEILNGHSQEDCRTNPNEATGISDSQTVAEGENLTTPNVECLNGRSQEDCRANTNEATGLSDSQTVAEGENLTTPHVEILNGLSQEDCQTIPNEATGLSDTQTVAERENFIAPDVENFNDHSQEDCRTRNLTPSKRDRSYLERDNQVSRSHAGSTSSVHGNDTHLQITKKLKQYASQIGLVAGLPTVRDEQPESLVDELNLDLPDKETKNTRRCSAEIGTSNGAPSNEAHENVRDKGNSNVEKSQRTPLGLPCNRFHSNNLTHEAQHDTDSDPVREFFDNRDGYQDERKDIATKKYDFLSSQCTFTQDSFATLSCTEPNFCMKCEKGGELLVCSRNACPIVVHQSCLGSAPSFDDNGKFICPFCSYSHALADYYEIKRKASLIRRDLAVFVSCQPNYNKQRQDDNLTRNDQ